MSSFRVNAFLKDKLLISRETARLLEEPLRERTQHVEMSDSASGAEPVIVDFEGVAGIAPSCFDELLFVFRAVLSAHAKGNAQSILIANPPTELSPALRAIARGHGMSVQAQADGSWLLTRLASSDK